jgi:hypothetical protein
VECSDEAFSRVNFGGCPLIFFVRHTRSLFLVACPEGSITDFLLTLASS